MGAPGSAPSAVSDAREGVSDSPTAAAAAANSMDPNNAAYLALRNHPETTIRPIAGEGGEEGGHETRHHTAGENNIFKQVNFIAKIPYFTNQFSSFWI